ncbi:hypothetical protein VKT23_008190 [Stygiomarasmius scandens]|uniref:HAT C-terminal dimerisation domain-containing protein n=1 Tax=Marasmiellus scandens TaxID=2682957 RepID=A0ABR1JIN9_9AGAR
MRSESPAIIEPPKKRQQIVENINNKSLGHVWGMKDEDIITAYRNNWTSRAYDHYEVSIVRNTDTTTRERTMRIAFDCKYQDFRHARQYRDHGSSTGTTNLKNTANSCDARDPINCLPKASLSDMTTIGYSEARHRAIIALRCTRSKRAFKMVEDELYLQEVELLRPGTIVPSADTVVEDVQRLYVGLATVVKNYFQARGRELHAVVDGWTAPITEQYLGVEIIWEDNGTMYNMTLEFIRLTEQHTGAYLAEQLANVLKRYGLDKFPKKKKSVKATKGSVKHSIAGKQVDSDETMEVVLGVVGLGENEDVDDEDLELAEALGADGENVNDIDPAHEAHDKAVTKAIRDVAVRDMKLKGIIIGTKEANDALKLFPKVAGLAKKIHDSGPVKAAFETYRNTTPDLNTNVTSIHRRNATRWGSEKKCIETYNALRSPIDKLLKDKDLKLGSYRLNETQDRMMNELYVILQILDKATLIFQQKIRPLIVEVIPAFKDLEFALDKIANHADYYPVTRVAAYAGLLMIKKYYSLIDVCEAYRIAIVMCPNRKLEWFSEHLCWDEDAISSLKSLVINRFAESYAPPVTMASTARSATSSAPEASPSLYSVDQFTRSSNHRTHEPRVDDDIRSYLNSRTIDMKTKDVLLHWSQKLSETPYLAKFALSFCSTPATSADSERSFSEGRTQVAWNQTNMSSQAFRAQMAIGSWYRAPFFKMEQAFAIMEATTAPLRP